jgi:asparagine synthase (glutamine-hydrolysing)
MCGIFGVSSIQRNEIEKAHTALHTLTHRGPDGWHFKHQNNVYLGHRRLSILDLSENGQQPMVKDGVYLTVNGEIYNFKSLNEELIKNHDVKFKSSSDSEALLHGYIHWGIEKLLDKIEGMFSFCIYDSNRGEIFLARDHVGIKPLYYGFIDGKLSWGSELKALESFYGEGDLNIDYTAVYDFLTYMYVPSPKSLYKHIFKLPPAHYVSYNLETKEIVKKRYWQVQPNRHITHKEEAYNLVKNTIEQSVKSHLVSDVPVGSFLSGGVDSSIVSYEASKCLKELNTCSIGFDDMKVDESKFAKAVATVIGANHKTEIMNHDFVNKKFHLLKDMFDEPFADTSAFPTYAVSRLASENMTVVLTGDGGDELYGGYNHYMQWYQRLTRKLGFLAPVRPLISWIKNKNLGAFSRFARKAEIFAIFCPLERRVRLVGGFLRSDKVKKDFRKKHNIPNSYDELWHVREYYRKDLPYKSRGMFLDFHTSMTDDILCKVDRASMAHSIETRVPLLSKAVIDAAWQLDEKFLFEDGELKSILKKLYEGVLPKECLYRHKQGFSLGVTSKSDKLHSGDSPISIKILNELFNKVF